MSNPSGFDFIRFRDGTSQQQRTSRALDPDSFALDERSLRGLLQFARRYAGTLIYYNQNNEQAGDWSAFLEGDEDTLNEMVAFLKNPGYFDNQPEKKERYSRPHFALFLTFLALLQEAREQMNQITRRQLDFYYQQALGLHRHPGRADEVHLLAELEPEEGQALIPKGTLLVAGEDEEGDPILYETDDELLANQARLARVMSLHVEKEVSSLASIREFEKDTAFPERAFIEALNLVYRQSGTENTPRRYPIDHPTNRQLSLELVSQLDGLADFIENKLGLRIPSFQLLVELYRAWENPLNWHRPPGKNEAGKKGGGINDYLERASAGAFTIQDRYDFNANFKAALGVQIDGRPSPGADSLFRKLDGIEDVYDLYKDYLRLKKFPGEALRSRLVEQAIQGLGFGQPEEFESMMRLRIDTLGHLEEAISLLNESPKANPSAATLNGLPNNALHLYYEKDKTLYRLISHLFNLADDGLDFPAWDKKSLTLTLPSSYEIDPEETYFEEGGFALEFFGAGAIDFSGSAGNVALEEELSALLPANDPTTFLKVEYNGSVKDPKVEVIYDEKTSQPVSFNARLRPGRLLISLQQEQTTLRAILDAWAGHSEKEGFQLEYVTPGLSALSSPPITLGRAFSTQLPANRPDGFLRVTYTGDPAMRPQLAVEQVEFQPAPATFEIPEDGELIIKVRNEKTPSEAILEAWQKQADKGNFSLEFIGEGSTLIARSDPENPIRLYPEFSTHFPAGATGGFLKITYAGPSAPPPGILIRVIKIDHPDNAAAEPVTAAVDPESGVLALTFKQAAAPLPIGEILKAWKKNPYSGGFFLEAAGSGSIDTTALTDSTLALNQKEFATRLPSSRPGTFLELEYTGVLDVQGVDVHLNEEPGQAVGFSTTVTAGAARLIITLQAQNTPVNAILKAWENFGNKAGFALFFKFNPFLLIPDGEVSLFKEFNARLPENAAGNFLQLRYRGLHPEPQVQVNPGSSFAMATSDKGAAGNITDEYFKIKGAQLAEIETYFNMQAEDYFFVRGLYTTEPGEDWPYRDPAWKWRRADELLLQAHQALFGPGAIPEVVRWKNLYIAPDAGLVLVPGFDGKEEYPRWKTFGKAPDPAIPEEADIITTGELGLLITSPALSLQEGRRILTLLLSFEESSFDQDRLKKFFGGLESRPDNKRLYPFDIQVSTEKEWIAIPEWEAFKVGPATLEITLAVSEEFAAFAPVADDPLAGPWPALKLVLRREKIDVFIGDTGDLIDESRRPYELLHQLLITRVELQLQVKGLKNIQAQNLQGSIGPQKPFEPFGPEPQLGDRLYITHHELAAQRLESLTLNLAWKNLPPEGLDLYYQPYTMLSAGMNKGDISSESFQVEMVLRQAHRRLILPPANPPALAPGGDPALLLRHQLFPADTGLTENALAVSIDADATFSPNQIAYRPLLDPALEEDVLNADRYLEISLRGQDFQHRIFPNLLTYQALTGRTDGELSEIRKVERFVEADGSESFIISLKGAVGEETTPLDDGFFIIKKAGDIIEVQGTFTAGSTSLPVSGIPDNTEVIVMYQGPPQGGAWRKKLKVLANVITLPEAPPSHLAHTDFTVKRSIAVTFHDEGKTRLRIADPANVPAGTEVIVFYPGPLLLQEPFTPVLDSLSIDYTTSVEIALPETTRARFVEDPLPEAAVSSPDREGPAPDRLLHLLPFGLGDIEKNGEWMQTGGDETGELITEKLAFRFLPQFDDEGELYLGVEGLVPPQPLSLLFQMAEGSANPDLPAASVEWACLAGHRWQELKGEQIPMDTTHGLQNSGIVRLNIPATASLAHTAMPAGLHWLRLRARRYSQSLNDSIAIHTQALRATWLGQNQEIGAFARILAPESIAGPQEPIPGLLGFLQPYSSFQGKAQEQMPAFYQRASERLRHRQRALTLWDYERLVLEQFPDIYRVKALAADLLDVDAPPGAVTVIVIPDIRFRRPFDPFEPKAPQQQLADIQGFLQGLAPPFAKVQVQNPRFDYLHVRAAVRFYDMRNFRFYADQLQREIKQYLSPWAFDQAAEITFGREIYLSMLAHFMENRPYVDFIDQPNLILKERLASDGRLLPVKGTAAVGPDGVARLRGPDVILVSTPDHTIEFLDDTIDPQKRILSGIGYAKLDLDFKVELDKD